MSDSLPVKPETDDNQIGADYVDQLLFWLADYAGKLLANITDFVARQIEKVQAAFVEVVNVLRNTITSMLEPVLVAFKTISTAIKTYVVDPLEAAVKTIQERIGGIITSVSTAINFVIVQVGNMLASLKDTVGSAIQTVITEFSRIGTAIKDALVSAFKDIEKVVSGLWDAFLRSVTGVVDKVGGLIDMVVGKIQTTVQTVISTISNVAQGVVNSINSGIQSIVSTANSIVESVKSFFVSSAGEILNIIGGLIDEIRVRITAEVSQITFAAGSLTEALGLKLGDIKTGFTEATTELVKAVTDVAEEQLKPLTEAIDKVASFFFEFTDAKTAQEYTTRVNQAIASLGGSTVPVVGSVAPGAVDAAAQTGLDVPDRKAWDAIVKSLEPNNPVARIAWGLIFSVGLVWKGYGGVVDAQAQVLLQEFALRYHFQLLSPPDAIAALHRGARDLETTQRTIVKQGYSHEDATAIIDNAEGVLGVGDLVSAWHRKEIDVAGLAKALTRHGYSDKTQGIIRALAFPIPPIGDLVTMAVREVFDRQQAEALGLFGDFPEEFAKYAAMQGLTREWAERYWGAHWTLPSATQGAEMLQRGIITPDEYEGLLKALDYSPAWRTAMKEISFNPLTRVDVRRMHALKILDDNELEQAYRDVGYDVINAKRLAEFTKRQNARNPQEDDVELGRLTRAQILNFYDDGLIPKEKALQLLTQAGIKPEAAALYILNVDHDDQRAERKAEIDLVLAQADAGVLTFAEAEDKLTGLGLETIEVQKAITKLLRAEQKATKLPSRDEGARLLADGAITLGDYEDLLKRLKYPAKWIAAFVKQASKVKRGN